MRDYGTARWEGGDTNCDHKGNPFRTKSSLDENFGVKQRDKLDFEFYKDICGKCGAKRIDNQIGLEKTPEEYVAKLVNVFREVKRVLKKEGTLWLNLGDSYAGSWGNSGHRPEIDNTPSYQREKNSEYLPRCGWDNRRERPASSYKLPNLKPKDLIGIPWRVAFALQADGWWLRQDIIWCLSGGTYVYAKTQNGVSSVMIRDIARLNPKSIRLWNGEKWTNVLGISKSKRTGNEIEIVLRSGERISCTPNHKFPTDRGLLEAKDIKKGDCITSTNLPETENPKDCVLDEDAGWFAGLYIADGSRSDDCIQISGHSKDKDELQRLQHISKKFGGYITKTIDGNNMSIRLYGKILNAVIDEFVSGKTSKDKGFASVVWEYSNKFISSMLDGYLCGDGHWDKDNNRWRLGFRRNYNLERDLRAVCARLGYRITLNLSSVKYKGKRRPIFKGEIRKTISKHLNNKSQSEVVDMRKARCRFVYDIGVEDEPHLFALSSGILTHNSKPNPMPESVTDRCTKAHEYIFLMSKDKKYYYDNEAIKENVGQISTRKATSKDKLLERTTAKSSYCVTDSDKSGFGRDITTNGRNKRSVWTIDSKFDNLDIEAEHRQGMHRERGNGTVEKRNLPDKTEFIDTLRANFNLAELVEKTGEPKTLIEHWFRRDDCFAYPTKEAWEKVKTDLFPELLDVWYESDAIEKNSNGYRNKRSVWTITTKPFKEAHFATFPEALIEPMVKAGCPEFICNKCGKAREAILERDAIHNVHRNVRDGDGDRAIGGQHTKWMAEHPLQLKELTDCNCNAGFSGGIVLDPFVGSGTTLQVARALKRNSIGIELNPKYIDIIRKRMFKGCMPLTDDFEVITQ